ncbi:MAG: hypothetical protein KFF74_00455 [Candidatus Nanosynbacter sp.]|nr:hypothetical protein [Candidatus Nanosynbacter sp.]
MIIIDFSPLLCYNASIKKAVIITAVLLLIAGTGGGLWLKTRLNVQAVTEVAQEQKQEQPKSKYDVGPPDAQEMLELVNQERTKVGAAPLKLDERLNASAQEKADDMQNRDYYGHVSPDGTRGTLFVFKHIPSKCRYAGENLANILIPDSNSRNPISTWMSSTKGHREAILDKDYDLVGFGIAKDKYGNSLIVQHFCDLN